VELLASAQRPGTRVRPLGEILRTVFGHTQFRPHQEQVCTALEAGVNALLVMPTGAGKSLCYQLPGLSRGGTTLVISPLIALMDDQVNKLCSLGLRAYAIHSGKPREHSRQACIDYLKGELDFLYIAPERLGVTRFADFLARKRPSLIAIDEAHCISHWGHDFRPDYRLLERRLPQLMPCPVVALTATATAKVQDDIIEQLGVKNVRRFVFGFRRTNLAIEVTEATPARRMDLVAALLKAPENRPAIVYAPTRKEAEKQAEALASLGAQAYHAGMTNHERDRVARSFLEGATDVVVATVAFGMGIDKADVRTVVHTALPSSIEGYYQEIGRAGRDGKPSRAVLLHSFADMRTHEWFLERDYPSSDALAKVFHHLNQAASDKETLLRHTRLDPDVLDRALDKLLSHGGAERVGYDDFVKGQASWRKTYETQLSHKQAQLSAMRAFAEGYDCRMLKLVSHFGDQEDDGQRCGQCDVCAPSAALTTTTEPISEQERQMAGSVLKTLRDFDGQSTGKLFRELGEGQMTRKQFDEVLSSLRRSGYLELENDEFEKDGKVIRYHRALLTLAGKSAGADLSRLQINTTSSAKGPHKKAAGSKKPSAGRPETRLDATGERIVATLKEWRRRQAAENNAPAYTVLTDRTIAGIAEKRPNTLAGLLEVHGIGPGLLDKYGSKVLELLAQLR
jgi:RecQ family ATP-dependent DNA helicase